MLEPKKCIHVNKLHMATMFLDLCHFFDIDVNNDDLLETIWEHMKQRKGGGGGGGDAIKLIYLHLHYFFSYLFLTFSKWNFN